MMADIQERRDDGWIKASDTRRRRESKRKNLARMGAEVIPIEHDHQDLGARDAGQRAVNCGLVTSSALIPLRRASSNHPRPAKRQGHQHAVVGIKIAVG
jgi:hypothetical protein